MTASNRMALISLPLAGRGQGWGSANSIEFAHV